MNREKNAEFCGSIPLNVINQIQDYGYLLIVEKESMKIVQVSENLATVFPLSSEELCDHSLTDFLPEEQLYKIKEGVLKAFKNKLPMKLSFLIENRKHYFDALIHFNGPCLIIELESAEPKEKDASFLMRFEEFKFISGALTTAKNTQELTDHVVKEIKKLTGFDKVMIYKFDEEYNGTVVSEVHEEGMDAYLGLRFPASDIPKQARAMYFQTPYRFIPNADYKPVKLQPVINAFTNTFTDLTSCNLRGVAGVHLEYLKNMNVLSSMSIRIIKDGRLWGLIACHHRTPKRLEYETCILLEILSDFISSQLTILEKEAEYNTMAQMTELNTRILEHAQKSNDIWEGLSFNDNLMKVLNITGIAYVRNKQLQTIGKTPLVADIKEIVRWIQKNKLDKVYSNSNFPASYDRCKQYKDICSGIVIIPLSVAQGDYLIGFRPEQVQQVTWGGNPNETIQFDVDGKKYHPRHSFNTWKEVVNEKSLPFQDTELKAADTLRQWLMEFILNNQSI